MKRNKKLLYGCLVIHAAITFAAGIVLILMPGAIPSTVDIDLPQKANLLAYFLGAAEIAIAFLSFGARKIKDVAALSLIIWTFIVFHLATALVELYDMVLNGYSFVLLINVFVRVGVIVLFLYLGQAREEAEATSSIHQQK